MSDTIELPARLDLPYAQKLLQDIGERDLSKGVTLDASHVSQMGTLCVQVILAAAREAAEAGGALKIENVNDRAVAQLGSIGLTPEKLAGGAT